MYIGSVKDNIGHTESASGVAGLLKTILMIQKGVIPKQANFSRLNPKIAPLEPDQMAIPVESRPWSSRERIAVVNNYGAAGSNAVLVVQEFDASRRGQSAGSGSSRNAPGAGVEFPFISAKSLESLSAYCSTLKRAYLPRIQAASRAASEGAVLANIAYNLATKQDRSMEYFLSFTAADLAGLSLALDAAGRDPSRVVKQSASRPRRPVVLCFGGQNGRTARVSEDLFHRCRLLQVHLVRGSPILRVDRSVADLEHRSGRL